MNAPATKVTPISGFPELLPAERLLELHFLDVIREVFELHGFAPLETRAVEPVDRLLGKGGDADKEIYGISRLAGDDSGRDAALGLHFDLTVPFARYVLENAGKLAFPFRRYQIQKVWRGERPQEGRFREFTQADIDVVDVGELAPHFEAEMPLVIAEAFAPAAGGGVPHPGQQPQDPRGLLPRHRARPTWSTTLRIVDRLARVGPGPGRRDAHRVGRERGPGAPGARPGLDQQPTTCPSSMPCAPSACEHPTLDEGLDALAAVISAGLEQAPGVLVADLSIARGLDYYTGTVYETQLVGSESWGSVCSGGRYDSLATDGRTTYPGVGISIGLTRLVHLLVAKRGLTASRSTPAAVLVAVVDEETRGTSHGVAAALRSRGIPCEVAPSAAKFGKQIRYADRRGIPFVWFPGAGEGGDQVKDIRSGEQVDADAATWQCPEADLKPTVVTP